ncbi:hypothetical protein C8F01DRAFT_1236485 [Mycena amicta]|nr:hypothetical protein C8F01DRAFT_1236485 [Mycena amicta]
MTRPSQTSHRTSRISIASERTDGTTALTVATGQACSSSHQRCSERESQSESDEEAKIGRSKPRMAFTSRTRTKGSVAHEGTTDAPRNGEVLKKEFWNEGMSRPVPKAPPGFRKGEEEPENTKGKNRVNTEKEKKETNQKCACLQSVVV